MNKDKIKIVLLSILITVFLVVGYQKGFFISRSIPKKQFLEINDNDISKFVKNAQSKGSASDMIVRFFNLDIFDLEKERFYYENWQRKRFVNNEKDYYEKPGAQIDYIVLPLLHFLNKDETSSVEMLADILRDEASYQTGKYYISTLQSSIHLGGSHTIFDSNRVKLLAESYGSKVVYSLYKEFNTSDSNKLSGNLTVILLDNQGKFLKQHSTTKSFDNDVVDVSARIELLLNENKELITKAIFNPEFDNIKDYYTDFFKDVLNPLRICNSSKLGKWDLAEKNRHEKLIDSFDYDLIVLPVQETDSQNDRVAHIMSSRFIASEIGQVTKRKVMSPELVVRLLGSHQLLFDIEDVNKLAEKLSAEVVYLLKRKKKYKRGDKGNPEVEFSAVLTNSSGGIIKEFTTNIGTYKVPDDLGSLPKQEQLELLTDPQPTLEMQIEAVKGDVITKLFAPPTSTVSEIGVQAHNAWILPEKISDIPQKAISALDHAAYLQLIGVMTPKILTYERRRLFERSLSALQLVGETSEHYKILKARALFHLYRRPFALPFLKEASTPEELAFKEYLNGNYSELQELTDKIENPLLHSIATIERHDLHYFYYKDKKENKSYKVPNTGWLSLIDYASRDKDGWHAPDNLTLFMNLKGLYPDFDAQLEKALRGNAVVSDDYFSNNGIELIGELFQLPGGLTSQENDLRYSEKISKADIWAFYRNIAIANMLKKLQRSAWVYGSYDTAIKTADSVEPFLKGHPVHMYYHAYSLYKKSSKLSGRGIQDSFDKAYQLVDDVFLDSCGVTNSTINSEYLLRRLNSDNPAKKNQIVPLEYSLRIDFGCYPSKFINTYWWHNSFPSLPFTNDDIGALKSVSKVLDDDFILKELDSRFNGHPEKATFHANYLIKNDRKKEGVVVLENEIENGTDNWATYKSLGELQLEGNVQRAKETLEKYPLFKNPSDGNRVGVSHNAYEAGNLFFDKGYFEESKPFYEIAASLITGAGSQYRSSQKLALLESDYDRLLHYSYKEAKRYNNVYAYQKYLTYLHVIKMHEDSEAGFQKLIKRFGNEGIWNSQLTGNRIQSKTAQEIMDSVTNIQASLENKKFFPRYVTINMILDRIPTDRALALVEKIEEKQLIDLKDDFFQERLNDLSIKRMKSIFRKRAKNFPVDNDLYRGSYSWFVRVYSSFLHPDSNNILDVALAPFLRQYDAIYPSDKNFLDVTDPTLMFGLPYLTIATVKEGSDEQVQGYDSFIDEALSSQLHHRKFELQLSKAILLASEGNSSDAITHLESAYSANETIEYKYEKYRPLPRVYQLLQLCEWLYSEYNDQSYLEPALKWVAFYNTAEPHTAWAYSFKALYGKTREQRVQAAAFANFLDPQSYWLSLVGEDILNEAVIWWGNNNPFILKESERNENEGKEKI